jgi:signal peptidase I
LIFKHKKKGAFMSPSFLFKIFINTFLIFQKSWYYQTLHCVLNTVTVTGAPMHKLIKEVKEIALIFLVIFTFRSSFLNWYNIPTGSMLPTLKIGDHIALNKLAYGLMLPLMESRIISWSSPARGDIVVIHDPNEHLNISTLVLGTKLIKRVVAIGGDVVSFSGGVLTLNGTKAHEELVSDRKILEDLGGGETAHSKDLYIESGFSQFPHHILRQRFGGVTNNETRTWTIPKNHLLLVGDNRDDSLDGRVWGVVDENKVYGRAFAVIWSTYDKEDSWLPSLRNNRWFMKLTN